MTAKHDLVTIWPDGDPTLAKAIKAANAIREKFRNTANRPDNVRHVAMIEEPDVLRADALRYARHCLNGDAGMIRPTFRLMSRRSDHFVVFNNLPDSRNLQAATAAVLATIIATTDLDAYWFVNEAWTANVNPDTPPDVAKLAPAQRTDRSEVVVTITCGDAGHDIQLHDIIRGGDDDPVTLGKAQRISGKGLRNPVMGNLFDLARHVMATALEARAKR